MSIFSIYNREFPPEVAKPAEASTPLRAPGIKPLGGMWLGSILDGGGIDREWCFVMLWFKRWNGAFQRSCG
jgi:hypothetical protein